MKKQTIRLICLLAAILPLQTAAQSNIKAAFDAIINCQNADVSPSHSLEKDPTTGIKTGQDDIYRFTLPASKKGLVKKAMAAFEKDIPQAYSVKSGKNNGTGSQIVLHSEDTGFSGISVDDPGTEYIYALFLPSKAEDPEGKYRYSYGMNYKEENGQITGKLIINYATTLKYRQGGQNSNNQFIWRDGTSITTTHDGVTVIQSYDGGEGDTWFEKVMKCVNGMSQAPHKTRLALATKAYSIITDVKKYPEVTRQDKEALRQIFRAMRLDKKKYSDPTLNALLLQCENAIQ